MVFANGYFLCSLDHKKEGGFGLTCGVERGNHGPMGLAPSGGSGPGNVSRGTVIGTGGTRGQRSRWRGGCGGRVEPALAAC